MRSPFLYETLRRFCLGAFAVFHRDLDAGADLPFAFEEHGSYGRPTLYEYRPLVRGYVEARTPEQTTAMLEAKLPRRYWIEINSLLVPFGKHICTGQAPRCSTCPVLEMCQQVGVASHR